MQLRQKATGATLDGTLPRPDPVATATADDAATLTQWDKHEQLAKSLLTQNVHQFLDELQNKREELSIIGVVIDKKDY